MKSSTNYIEWFLKKQSGPNCGKRWGLMVATKTASGEVCIGTSKCHSSKDKFSEKTAIAVAQGRMDKLESGLGAYVNGDEVNLKISLPSDIRRKLPKFVERCKRYFKTEAIKIAVPSLPKI